MQWADARRYLASRSIVLPQNFGLVGMGSGASTCGNRFLRRIAKAPDPDGTHLKNTQP
jgi:hypothetical protein